MRMSCTLVFSAAGDLKLRFTCKATLPREVMCATAHLGDLVYSNCQAAKVWPARHCEEAS